MEAVSARRRGDGQLRSARSASFGGCQQRIDAELLDRVQRNFQPHPWTLRLIHDAGRVDAIVGPVAVVKAASSESNRSLIAPAGVNGAGDEGRQRGPVAPV